LEITVIVIKVKVKVHFTLEQATKAQGKIEIQLYSFFNIGTRLAWVVNAMHQPL